MAFSISGTTGLVQNSVDLVLGAFLTSQVVFLAQSTAPTGFLKCNGAAVSRTVYANLFAAIGTTFGVGDGSTTFNLPDLRGEFIRGWDDSRGVDSGRSFASSQSEMTGPHNHTISGYVSQSQFQYAGGGGTAGIGIPYSASNGSVVQNNSGTENRPRNVALLACIKY